MSAEVLVEALPYIQEYAGKIIVVKYGGNAMINEDLKQAVIEDIVLLNLVGIKVVLVHGGGPEISEMLKKIGKESKFVKGLRYTDRETMDIVQMILCGKVNKNLVSLFEKAGGRAVGLGGMDEETNYNINADTAAEKLAVALKAKKLILLTDVCGLMRDPKDDSTLIPRLKVSEVPALIKEGVISGGMIPKVDCCVEAVRQGVERANIQDGRVPHSILVELLSDDGVGTMFS